MRSLLREIWRLKLYWIAPIIVSLAAVGLLLALTSGDDGDAPQFIYTVF